MLGELNQGEDGTAEGGAQSDKRRDVDRVGRKQTGNKRPEGHAAHAGDLRRIHAQPGNESSREDGAPTASLQQPGGPLQRTAGVKRLGDPHQTVPAEELRYRPANDGAESDADRHGADEEDGIDASTRNRDAPDGEHEVTWRKGERHPRLLDEHQDADRHHQGRPVETLKPGNRVHLPILRGTVSGHESVASHPQRRASLHVSAWPGPQDGKDAAGAADHGWAEEWEGSNRAARRRSRGERLGSHWLGRRLRRESELVGEHGGESERDGPGER